MEQTVSYCLEYRINTAVHKPVYRKCPKKRYSDQNIVIDNSEETDKHSR